MVKNRSAGFVFSAVGLSACITWQIIGPMNEELGSGETSLDYIFKPPHYIGYFVAIIALVCGVALMAFRKVLPPRDWKTIFWCTLAGSIAGFAYRLISTGGHGANIGGGIALYLGPPLVATLGWSAYRRLDLE